MVDDLHPDSPPQFNNPRYLFLGYRPDASILRMITEGLRAVVAEGPKNANATAHISKVNDVYRLEMRLNFQGKEVFAIGSGDDVKSCLQRTLDQIFKQIRS